MAFFSSLFGGNNKGDSNHINVSQHLSDFLRNQIDTLGRDGHLVHINEITVGYIFHLTMLISKKPVSLSDVRQAMKDVFTEEPSRHMIENAIGTFQRDSETQEKLAALFPIAKQEFEAGSGDFLIRHTRKAHEAIEAMFTEEFDPEKVPRWTANDLA